jgi:hypothetical protein
MSEPTQLPPGKGPAERRWDAAYRDARQTGDLLTLELLDDAWSAVVAGIRHRRTRPVPRGTRRARVAAVPAPGFVLGDR